MGTEQRQKPRGEDNYHETYLSRVTSWPKLHLSRQLLSCSALKLCRMACLLASSGVFRPPAPPVGLEPLGAPLLLLDDGPLLVDRLSASSSSCEKQT